MKKENNEFLNIKQWAPEDRPREKLMLKGKKSLSDTELIAILLGTGTASMSALDVAKSLLQAVDNDLHALGQLTVKELTRIKGIGEAKAITIVSALELGRRRKYTSHGHRPRIRASKDAYKLVQHLTDIQHEELWILLLNRSNQVIHKQQISQGGVAGTVVDPKIIFKTALTELASGIILAHNHPSGSCKPSPQDIEATKKVKESGKLLEIQLHDHIIVAGKSYYSFADEGLI